jgi:uncharacterized protein DUF4192
MSTFDNSGLDDVLAAIPDILTDDPAESFILVARLADSQDETTHEAVKRFDIATFAGLPSGTAVYVTRALAGLPVADLLAVITTHSDDPSGELPLRPEVDAFTDTLADMGFPDLETLFLPSFDAGTRWRCYQHPTTLACCPPPTSPPTSLKARPRRPLALIASRSPNISRLGGFWTEIGSAPSWPIGFGTRRSTRPRTTCTSCGCGSRRLSTRSGALPTADFLIATSSSRS